VGQLEKEKENMFKMIVEYNIQIQKMEAYLKNILKDKEQQINVGTSTLKIESTSKESTEELSKAMEYLSLRNVEIDKLKHPYRESKKIKLR